MQPGQGGRNLRSAPPRSRRDERLAQRTKDLEAKLAASQKQVADLGGQTDQLLSDVRQRHAGTNSEKPVAWTCTKCNAPHHNAAKLACRLCSTKRTKVESPPKETTQPAGQSAPAASAANGAKKKGKNGSEPLSCDSVAFNNWLTLTPGCTPYVKSKPAAPLSDGTSILIEEDDLMEETADLFPAPSQKIADMEELISVLAKTSSEAAKALLESTQEELRRLKSLQAPMQKADHLPPAAAESAASKITRALANTRQTYSSLKFLYSKQKAEKEQRIEELQHELNELEEKYIEDSAETDRQIAHLTTNLRAVTGDEENAPETKAVDAVSLAAVVTPQALAPFLQVGIDHLIQNDPRFKEVDEQVVRQMLGAYAANLTLCLVNHQAANLPPDAASSTGPAKLPSPGPPGQLATASGACAGAKGPPAVAAADGHPATEVSLLGGSWANPM